jgi:hypothetical protein
VVIQPYFHKAGDEDEESERDDRDEGGERDDGDEGDESGFPNNWKDAQTRVKVSQAARAGSSYKQRVRAMVMSAKAEGRRPLAKGEGKPLMVKERGKGNDTESDDTSDEEEHEAGDVDDDDSDSDEEGGDRNEEDEYKEVVISIGKRNTVIYAVEEHNDVRNNRDEQDAEEHYEDE